MIVALFLAAATPPPAVEAAIYAAAGFARKGAEWRSPNCVGMEGESYQSGAIETFEDLNGDGRPEAVVTESSGICYGNTGTHFWLLSKQADGTWKPMLDETAMPGFAKTKGAGGWPDIELGGPGFCFPVLRWNGRAFVRNRFEYEGKPCRP
jgi:hypothetical protein